VAISGTSNIHPYTASTTTLRVVQLRFAPALNDPAFLDEIVSPEALTAFEIAIPAATLTSPKEGIDKNMHKALKVEAHPEITFRLTRLERGDAPGVLRAVGTLQIAGVSREVALNLTATQRSGAVSVKGELQLLMTDYGVTPPKALMGMLKTDPKVTVTFETTLSAPLT
jgi:polyisoprenoid-binding protein YceI